MMNIMNQERKIFKKLFNKKKNKNKNNQYNIWSQLYKIIINFKMNLTLKNRKNKKKIQKINWMIRYNRILKVKVMN